MALFGEVFRNQVFGLKTCVVSSKIYAHSPYSTGTAAFWAPLSTTYFVHRPVLLS
jgi:hypothetical protein